MASVLRYLNPVNIKQVGWKSKFGPKFGPKKKNFEKLSMNSGQQTCTG